MLQMFQQMDAFYALMQQGTMQQQKKDPV